jgi:hypothetical protein
MTTDTLPITPVEPSERARQNTALLKGLRERAGRGAGVGAWTAWSMGIYRLSARVYDLRLMGHSIRTEKRPGQTATYFLEDA